MALALLPPRSSQPLSASALRRHLPFQSSDSHSFVGACDSLQDELVFDLTGVDASIANALRRIMLAEVGASGSRASVPI